VISILKVIRVHRSIIIGIDSRSISLLLISYWQFALSLAAAAH
jgi:hypothetical protein